MDINYISEQFPAGAIAPQHNSPLLVTWDELLWSALTVGRPNRYHVWRHGVASLHEALFRVSMIRMALEQVAGSNVLTRTRAASTLDPSEKGAVNYFLGMVYCRLFAAKVFDAPWALHLDVFHAQIGAILHSNSRPDLVAQRRDGDWVVFEAKGRVRVPTADDKRKAKEQAGRVVRIGTRRPLIGIAGIFYHQGDEAKFFMRDPEPDKAKGIELSLPKNAWAFYYQPLFGLMTGSSGKLNKGLATELVESGIVLPGLDVRIKVVQDVVDFLLDRRGDDAKEWCDENEENLLRNGYRADGIRVTAGESWGMPFGGIEGMETVEKY